MVNTDLNNIYCSREEYDSILDCPRPNGSSKTWNFKEEGKVSMLKTLPFWDELTTIKGRSMNELRFGDDFKPISISNLEDHKHLYIIRVYNPQYFLDNIKIGFSCISEKVLEDVRSKKALIVVECTSEGVYQVGFPNKELRTIDKWREESNLPEYSVCALTGNLKSPDFVKDNNLKIRAFGQSTFENDFLNPDYLNFNQDKLVNYKPDDKDLFLFYSRAPRNHRVYLGFLLDQNNLLNFGKMSLMKINDNREDSHLTDLERKPYFDFIKGDDFHIDRKLTNDENLANTFIREHYESTFISITGESYPDDETCFFSEKTFKPIYAGHPFLMYNGVNSLEYLKDLGYKTFDAWIDESYDTVPTYQKRAQKIIELLHKFKTYSIDDKTIIRNEMKEVLEHNNSVLRKKLHDEFYRDNLPLGNILRTLYKEL